ncbi:hypothetical protein HDU89_006843 [Geranomyces variabilis]|nr:hypothetical protein HDU89_006843 [Geranomyces variabilis]
MQDKLNAAVSDLTKIANFRPGPGLTWDHLNRAALPRQLHRFSRETSRVHGKEGTDHLVIRVGRTVTGLAWAIADILAQPVSVLFLAPPASGKTTFLRDVFGGASAESHSSIPITVQGIRLQKRKPGQVAMLAWRNFSPQTVIIDEIAEKAEAEATLQASPRDRQVRVIATSHGTLADFVSIKRLSALSGNITRSTITDARAEALDVFQKTRLERCIHSDLAAADRRLPRQEALVL